MPGVKLEIGIFIHFCQQKLDMRNKPFSNFLFTFGLIALMLVACNKEVTEAPLSKLPPTQQEVSPAIIDLLNCNGLQTDGAIQVGDYVQLEHDILMHVNDLDVTLKNDTVQTISQGSVEERQHVLNETTLITMANAASIKIYIDPSVTQIQPGGQDWLSAIQTALSNWEAVSGCRIDFSSVSSSAQANLSFFADNNAAPIAALRNLKASAAAAACFPSGGKIGRYITINDNGPSTTLNVKNKVMRHEIGHTLGLRHNNAPVVDTSLSGNNPCGGLYIGWTLVQGTPEDDPLSVMQQGNISLALGENDKKAVQFMYPDPYNVPNILGTSVKSCTTCGAGNRLVNITVNSPTQNPYKVLVERFSTTGTTPLQSTYFVNPGTQTTFGVASPTGSWRFRVSRLNYGSYKVSSAYVTVNVQ